MNKIIIWTLTTVIAIMLSGCATTKTPASPDEAVSSFVKDHLNVQFGDDATNLNVYADKQFMINMKKNFGYFDKAAVYYRGGKLYRVNIWADIFKSYSLQSTNERMHEALEAIALQLGLPAEYFACHARSVDFYPWSNKPVKACEEPNMPYRLFFDSKDWPNFRRYCIDIVAVDLEDKLRVRGNKSHKYPKVTDEIRNSWGLPLPPAK